jgi:hypothetical protein
MVRSISRLKIARPGGTTEHAKFNRPINDCSSHWFAIKWPTDWLKYHITIREFFLIVVAIQLWEMGVKPPYTKNNYT